MKPRFNQAKAAQLAGMLLKLRGGTMHYMKLIKLMYLVDRTALLQWGRPLTYDSYFSMRDGPILSETLNLIDEGPEPGSESPWDALIKRDIDHYCVTLGTDDVPTDELSEAEEELVKSIYQEYGYMNRYKLRDLLHQRLPEWHDPHGSSLPIAYRDILLAGDKTQQEIARFESEIRSVAFMDALAHSG